MDTLKIDRKLLKTQGAVSIRRCQNKDDLELWAGDVVVLDTANSTATNIAVKASSTSDDIDVYGVAIQHIAAGEYGEIQTEGPLDPVWVDGNSDIAVGDELAMIDGSTYGDTDINSTLGFTLDSTAVTDSGSNFTAAMVGRYIYKDSATTKYRITTVTDSDNIVITPAYREATASSASGIVTAECRAMKATAGKGGAFATALEAYTSNNSGGHISAVLFRAPRVDSTAAAAGDLLADGSVPLTANWDVGAYTITGLTFTSDQATGTAPFTVASTTKVTNLNADQLDGNTAADFAVASHAMSTHSDEDTYNISTSGTLATGNATITGDLVVSGNMTWSSTLTVDELVLDTDGVAPAATNCYLVRDNSGDLTVNAKTGQEFHIAIAGNDEVDVSATEVDIHGNSLVLDADDDTSITADTDDQIDIEIAGADDFTFTANSFNVLSGSDLNIADDEHLQLGTTDDIVLLNCSAGIAADTTITGVLEGTVKSYALAANSGIISNITDDGDILIAVSKAGSSHTAFWADGSTGDTTLNAASGQSVDISIDTTKEYDFSASAVDMNANHIDNAGYIVLNAITWVTGETGIWNETAGELHLNAVTGKNVKVEIADALEYTFDATHLTLESGNFIKFLGNNGIQDSAGNEVLYIEAVGSATQYLNVKNANAANVVLENLGSTADLGFTFTNDQDEEILILNSAAGSVNELTIASSATGVAPTITASGETNVPLELVPKGTGCLLFSGPITEKITQTAKTDSVTLTIAELLTKVIDGTPTAAANYTLPTAAALVAGIVDCAVGTSFHFYINNKSAGANTITVVAGGATLDGTVTVAQNVVREFVIIVTNVTGSSEAYSCYGLGA